MTPSPAVDQYRFIQALKKRLARSGRHWWGYVDQKRISESWAEILRTSRLVTDVELAQLSAAVAGASYSGRALAEQDDYESPDGFVNPAGFVGYAPDGRDLDNMLYSPAPRAKQLIGGGMAPEVALVKAGAMLTMSLHTLVSDAGRASAGVDVATRPGVGYVRMLNPPSCARCSVLAGKYYRWNAGFMRHPNCDCIHVPAKGADAATSEGLIHDPYEYFFGLSEEDQNRHYTEAGAQAIRDGADLFQVVNARSGMKPGGLVTTQGTGYRSHYGGTLGMRGQPRLTPEAIYSKNLSRADTLAELEKYGYILPGGQDPMGVIRGQSIGFGQFGRGGTRVGAREAVEKALREGRRDGSRYTMTAAELRVDNARLRWEAVTQGRNPYGSGSLTPQLAAKAEAEYRYWLYRGGQIHTN